MGSLRGRRRRGQRPARGDPVCPVGGTPRSDAGGDRAADPRRTARRNGPRALAALRAGTPAGRGAETARRRAGRLPARRHARPPDAADEHRGTRDRAASGRGPVGGVARRSRVDRAPGRTPAANGEPAARGVAPRRGSADAATGGLRGPAARRADVGRASRRSAVRARRGRPAAPCRRRRGPARAGPVGGARQRGQVQPAAVTRPRRDRGPGRAARDHDSRPWRGHGHRDSRAAPSSSSIAPTPRDVSRRTGAGSDCTPRMG